MGSPFSFHSKRTTGERDNFVFKLGLCAKALGRVSRQTPFSPVELSKSLFKGFGIQKGPSLPLLGDPTGENHRTFEVAKLCAVGDAQCKTKELP